jgi:hypothetical protein
MDIEVDYLVVGGGAMAMAFVDVMLSETDSTFAIVDHRHVPGGHWNDAYPFVRLHQPSRFYGAASTPLGQNRKDTRGLNSGLYELASGVEIARYYHELMDDVLLPSGRVQFFPVSTYDAEGEIVELISGKRHQAKARRRIVDATALTTNIPLTHEPKFAVAAGVECVPPNYLPRLVDSNRHVCVLGAGKTAIDCVTWLLSQDFPAANLTWVMPRDSWFLNRAHLQPGYENFDNVFARMATQYEICANSETVEELCTGMEAKRIWLRMDKEVWPTMFHAATITELELAAMRQVRHVLRRGHVTSIQSSSITFGDGDESIPPDTLFVDCTASAVEQNVNRRDPVFAASSITLQMLRPFQPCFSAALIGYLEASMDDDETRAKFAQPTPMTDTVEDWLDVYADGMVNAGQWSNDPELSKWLRGCRLNAFIDIIAQVRADDSAKQGVFARLAELGPLAVGNLKKLAANVRLR